MLSAGFELFVGPRFNDKLMPLPLTRRFGALSDGVELSDAVLELIVVWLAAYGDPVGLKLATGPLTSAYDTFKQVPDDGSSIIFANINLQATLLFSLSPIIVMQRSCSVISFGFCDICTYEPLSSLICLMYAPALPMIMPAVEFGTRIFTCLSRS